MRRFWKRGHGAFELEAELRAGRPQPRREYLDALAARVRQDRPHSRLGSLRIALATGLTGLILVALASTGGLSYLDFRTASHKPSHDQYGKRCGNPNKPGQPKGPRPCPIQVSDAKVKEGNSGTTSITFAVTIADGYVPDETVTVNYLTVDGTALAVSDYIPVFGTLTFQAGETAKSVTVQVVGDTVREPNETFSLVLANPSASGVIVDGEGVGTIVNDDKR